MSGGRYSGGLALLYHGVMNLGLPEMIFIFVVALIIFGPRKMPEIGRQIGRALAEFKRASNEFKSQIETEINQLEAEANVPHPFTTPSEPETANEPPPGTIAVGAAADSGGQPPLGQLSPPAKGNDV